MLIIWIQNMIHKKIPICGLAIRQQALEFYKFLKKQSATSSNETFFASRGWFDRFKTRFSLHNVSFSGEKASADQEAAAIFPSQLKSLINDKGYVTDQIFNCDETGLNWKKMPARTFLTKNEKSAPGFKVSKDRFTLLFCANSSGSYRCKPMLIYKSETPRAFKNKRKEHLPVFWRSNKSAWATKIIFKDWFLNSFIPEVKEFLSKKNLAFKVLLLMDNVASHDPSLQDLHPDVEVVFLPPNTTSLLQPMDQSVISTFKALYMKHVMDDMLKAVNHGCLEAGSSFKVNNFWKKFTILDAIGYVDKSWNEIKNSTLNRCWSKLLPDAVVYTIEEISYEKCVKDLLRLGREIGGEGFEDMNDQDVLEIIQPTADLSVQDIYEMMNDRDMDQDQVQANGPEETILKMSKISTILGYLRDAVEEAITFDPIMTRSLRFKYDCDMAMQTYENLYQDMARRRKQTNIMNYFSKTN